jgi:hypothetical protein
VKRGGGQAHLTLTFKQEYRRDEPKRARFTTTAKCAERGGAKGITSQRRERDEDRVTLLRVSGERVEDVTRAFAERVVCLGRDLSALSGDLD